MHLLLRTLWQLLAARRRSPLGLWDGSSLRMRVWPTDVDMFAHINNGMYFSLMDLGRFDLLVRSGAWEALRRQGWSAVVAAETIAFRKSLNLWQRYTIETRILGADDKAIYFEQRMVAGGEIYARAYVAARLVSAGGPVSTAEIFALVGEPPADRVLPDWIHQWREDNALPGARRPAPHRWK